MVSWAHAGGLHWRVGFSNDECTGVWVAGQLGKDVCQY